MARTQITGKNILDGSILNADVNLTASAVPIKNQLTLNLISGGTANNNWLCFGDANVVSNKSPWVPSLSYKLSLISFSNANVGTTKDNLVVSISAIYNDFSTTADITTTDSVAWTVSSTQASEVCGLGRAWKFDASSLNYLINPANKYAFLIKRINTAGPSINIPNVILTFIEV